MFRLIFCFQLNKKLEKPQNKDLDNVPDRKSAVEALQRQREGSGVNSTLKYDRSSMMALNPLKMDGSEVPKVPKKVSTTSKPEVVHNGQEKEGESANVPPKTFKERLAELKVQVAAKQAEKLENPRKIEAKEQKKPKFK